MEIPTRYLKDIHYHPIDLIGRSSRQQTDHLLVCKRMDVLLEFAELLVSSSHSFACK